MRSPARAVGAALALVALAGALVLWRTTTRETPALAPRSGSVVAESAAAVEVDELSTAPCEEASVARTLVEAAAGPESSLGHELPPGTALVRVRVVERGRGEPVAGLRCSALPVDRTRWSVVPVDGARAEIGEAALTDAEGRCELVVEGGRKHDIRVGPSVNHAPEPVPALALGDIHEVTVVVFEPQDPCLLGRVVDGEMEAPIEGAHVELAGTETTTDAGGWFRVEDAQDGLLAMVTAAGYGPRSIWIDAGCETAESAAVVRLRRGGTIEITVRDARGAPVADARGVARTDAFRLLERAGESYLTGPDPRWGARIGADGRCVLLDLPPRVPIRVELRRGEELVHRLPDLVDLAPGEARSIEIQLGSPVTLLGTVLDQAEEPIGDLRLWLVAAQGNRPQLDQLRNRDISAQVATDSLGRFEIPNVPAGSWWIGPSPRHEDRGPDAVARTVELVQVQVGAPLVDVVLHFDRGLFLSGTVLDPAGLPAGSVFVFAWVADTEAPHSAHTRTDPDGVFSLGPLRSGRYRVTAGETGEASAPALTAEADAGSKNVVLRLRLGGSVRGSVVDQATGQVLSGHVDCAVPDGSIPLSTARRTTAAPDGTFTFEGLAPGRYTFGARTDAGQYGFSKEVEVGAGENLERVRIETSPGGRLRLRYIGADAQVGYRVSAQGLRMVEGALHRDEPSECSVPAEEELQIELKRGPDSPSRAVRVPRGETVEVVLLDE